MNEKITKKTTKINDIEKILSKNSDEKTVVADEFDLVIKELEIEVRRNISDLQLLMNDQMLSMHDDREKLDEIEMRLSNTKNLAIQSKNTSELLYKENA